MSKRDSRIYKEIRAAQNKAIFAEVPARTIWVLLINVFALLGGE